MKTLREEISEVLKSRTSKTSKRNSLIKLGLNRFDVELILSKAEVKGFDVADLTFGVEIECYNVARQALITEIERRRLIRMVSEGYNHRDNNQYFKIVSDSSICGNNGQEIVSPVLKGTDGKNSLKEACRALNACGAKVNRSTGLHVHMGAENLSDKHYINIFKNYQKLEKAIDSFMPVSRREYNNSYCNSFAHIDLRWAATKADVAAMMPDRYYKVNAQAYARHRTIEFRQHSGTTSYAKIAMWLNFLTKLVAFSADNVLTESVNRIEDIPFLTAEEKYGLMDRRAELTRTGAEN